MIKKKQIIALTLLILLVFSLSACGTKEPQETVKKYSEGTYAVGTDMPAGEYVLYSSERISPKLSCKVSSDIQGFNVLYEKKSSYNILTIKLNEGEYLTIKDGYAIDISDSEVTDFDKTFKNCLLKVGTHIPAGEYLFHGSVAIFSNSRDTDFFKVNIDYFSNYSYMADDTVLFTLAEGEYVSSFPELGCDGFIPVNSNTQKRETKNCGMYKIGLDLLPGQYKFKGVAKYYSALDFWSHEGTVSIYNGRELVETYKVLDTEEKVIALSENQYIVVDFCDIIGYME